MPQAPGEQGALSLAKGRYQMTGRVTKKCPLYLEAGIFGGEASVVINGEVIPRLFDRGCFGC